MLIFLCPVLPFVIPIAIGAVLLGALGLFITPAAGASQIIAVALAVLF